MLRRASSSSWAGEAKASGGVSLGVAVDQQGRQALESKAAARLIAVVVLPTPPFWLTTAMTFDGLGAGCGLLTGWMVIIGVKEGYREGGLMAMRVSLCRNAEGCGELVELSFCAGILRVSAAAVWKSFVPRGTFRRLHNEENKVRSQGQG